MRIRWNNNGPRLIWDAISGVLGSLAVDYSTSLSTKFTINLTRQSVVKINYSHSLWKLKSAYESQKYGIAWLPWKLVRTISRPSMMLPPISPAVLEKNPRFKILYQDLSNSRLNPDGSSRLIKQQRAQADIEKVIFHCAKTTFCIFMTPYSLCKPPVLTMLEINFYKSPYNAWQMKAESQKT